MNNLFLPRLVAFGVCVIAFFIGLYFNKRDEEQENLLQEKKQKEQEQRREQWREHWRELQMRAGAMSAVQAMNPELQTTKEGAGAAGQTQGEQPKRIVH